MVQTFEQVVGSSPEVALMSFRKVCHSISRCELVTGRKNSFNAVSTVIGSLARARIILERL